MILDDVKKRILGRVPLVGLIGETVALTARGDHHSGRCPFQEEKSPSFAVYHDHYFCYGCKQHGDAITFVRYQNGFNFFEALRYLAAKYGVEAPELDESQGRMGRARQDAPLFEMMSAAQLFYETTLRDPDEPAAAEAREYLAGRGFTPENINAYGFGLTPRDGSGLVRHLRAKGYKDQDLLACALATESARDHRTFDFFRNRVTLPIRDPQGRVVGFGGRTMDGNPAKYLNSRETKLFDKSHTLFGFDHARKRIREKGRAIIVEGYMDALQLWQSGIEETVACLGTAFTEGHLKQLRHATGQVILLFDGDGAGQKATLAAVAVALTVPEIHVKAVQLPAGEDPDSYVRKHGPDALRELITKSADLLDFAIGQRLAKTHHLAVPELVIKEFLPWLAKVPDRMQRSFLAVKIAQLTGIPATQIEGQLATPPSVKDGDAAAAREAAARVQRRGADRAVAHGPGVGALASARPLDAAGYDLFGNLFHAQPGELDLELLRSGAEREIELDEAQALLLNELLTTLEAGEAPAAVDPTRWVATMAPEIAALVDRLKRAEAAFRCTDRGLRLGKLLAVYRQRKVKATIGTLKTQMARLAAVPGNDDEVRQILRTIGDLTKGLATS